MRFMIIVKASPESEAGIMPPSELIAAMGRYNETLIDAGILLVAEGLQASSKGARIKSEAGKITVTDGPFTETKELIAGFWLVQVKDRAEALEWCKRIPFEEGQEVELRQVFESFDFPADSVTREHLEAEQAWREANEKPITR
ncbi:MAG: YCII-related [Devosia sp.]|uniref:YciI family protein n=1 Tax=Devosia sp. TaxID=1871048 RepID=UPI0026307A3C|nr:YciI family protein [Devosia sp.]MDB5586381.1 YCII-related [Devosia sp.]